MPMIPGGHTQTITAVEYPPPVVQVKPIPLSVLPDNTDTSTPRRYVEMLFGSPGVSGLVWLLDFVHIGSTSTSIPECYIGALPSGQASLWVPSIQWPYGDVDRSRVIDRSPDGWHDTADLGGVVIDGDTTLSVLFLGVTQLLPEVTAFIPAVNGPYRPAATCWARVHYRLGVVAA